MFQRLRQKVIRTTTKSIIAVGVVEAFTSLPSEGRRSEFYHRCADFGTFCLRSILDAENAHMMALKFLKMDLGPLYNPKIGISSASVPIRDSVTIKELYFPSCVGLAAGFDKDGIAISELLEMGFGFIEIGSITPEPQPGNPKPRLFRLVEDKGVINRYGFNSAGLDEVEKNLKSYYGINRQGISDEELAKKDWKIFLISSFYNLKNFVDRIRGVDKSRIGLLGINLGKNKWRESLEETVEDYVRGIDQLGPYADYIVINISSPNTPGLRTMQKRQPMIALLEAAVNARDNISIDKKGRLPPLFVKIAPDLSIDEMEDIAGVIRDVGVDGVVISNTTNSRPESLISRNRNELGGLSGKPLNTLSTECIRRMYKLTNGEVPIIGVGGVGSGHDVYEKLRAGASVVQLYSMLTYEGPGLVTRIRNELSFIMKQNGHRTVEDIIGLDHDDIFWRKQDEKRRHERKMEKNFKE